MKSFGLTGMVQKCISTRERPVPGRERTAQSRTGEHSRFSVSWIASRYGRHRKLESEEKKSSSVLKDTQ
jgi:hypothetical protein